MAHRCPLDEHGGTEYSLRYIHLALVYVRCNEEQVLEPRDRELLVFDEDCYGALEASFSLAFTR